MQANYYCFRLIHLFWLLIFFFNAPLLQGRDANRLNSSPEELKEYYTFLTTLAADSPEDSIAQIKEYLETHGTFERVYVYLLEHLLYGDQLPQAKAYFQNLAPNPDYRQNSQWMLAKLFTIEDSSELAYDAYQQALAAGLPSLLLLNDFIEFLHQYERRYDALQEIERLNLPPALTEIARALWFREKYDFERLIRIIRQLPPEYAYNEFILHLLGYSYLLTSQDSLADSAFRRGLEMARKHEDWQFESFYLTTIGNILTRNDNQKEGLQYLNQSSALVEKIDDLMLREFVESNLGLNYSAQEDYSRAEKCYRRAINISERLGLYSHLAMNYMRLAQLYIEWENFNNVLDELDRGEKIAGTKHASRALFSLRMEKGRFLSSMKLTALAEYEFQKAYEWASTLPLKSLQYQASSLLASSLLEKKQYSEARKLYSEMFYLPEELVDTNYKAYWKTSIAESYYLEGKYDSALTKFSESFDFARKFPENSYLNYHQALARLRTASIEIKKGNADTAIEICQEDIVAQIARSDNSIKKDQYYYLGNAYKKKGDWESAINYYSKAVEIIEEERGGINVEQLRIGYFSEGIDVYNALIDSYFKRYLETGSHSDLEQLFYYLELTRARSLRDIRFEDEVSLAKVKESPQYQDYKAAYDELQSLQREIRTNPQVHDSLYLKYETARYTLLFTRLSLIKKGTEATGLFELSLGEVLKVFQSKGMGALLYHISKDTSLVLAMSGGQVKAIPLAVDQAKLSAAIDSLMAPFHAANEKTLETTPFRANIAYRLYNTLIKPVEDKMPLETRLLIVPDLILSALPFEMLLTAPPEKAEYFPTDAPVYEDDFLLRQYSLQYGPGTWLSPNRPDTAAATPRILVMANPVVNEASQSNEGVQTRSNWRRGILWYADNEGDSIKAVYPETDIFKRQGATMATWEKEYPGHQIQHFATHAFADTVFDAFSGLMLALNEDATDDGMLMGFEISDLILNCELVTMSACETGLGEHVAGEGVLGLPRLFMRAGADQVLMTLWKVGDKYSLALMPRFYDNFLNRGQTKAEALREAKLSMFKKPDKEVYYQHPFYWAAFTLYGEPDFPRRDNVMQWLLLLALFIILAALLIYFRRRKRAEELS